MKAKAMKPVASTNLPVKTTDRILYLDILRGMAILFIFLANSLPFSGWWDLTAAEIDAMPFPMLDYVLEVLCTIFIDGKWYSVFSILFGIGLVVQMHSMRERTASFSRFFTRRMMGLLLIGGLHLFLLWPGDILALYAFIGLVAVAFRNASDKRLLRLAIFLLCLPLINWLVLNVVNWNYVDPLFEWFFMEIKVLSGGREDGFRWMLENRDVGLFLKGTIRASAIRLAMLLESGRFFKVLALFFIGMWAGRAILYRNLLGNTALLKQIALWGVVVGLPMNLLRAYAEFGMDQSPMTGFFYELFYGLGTVPLACAYAALLAVAFQRRSTFGMLFAPVGRMALSNYLAQTILSITIYYGIGFGFAFQFGLSQIWLISLTIYGCQIALSWWWLSHFRFGPVEWLWRQMTYGKWIDIRHKQVKLPAAVELKVVKS